MLSDKIAEHSNSHIIRCWDNPPIACLWRLSPYTVVTFNVHRSTFNVIYSGGYCGGVPPLPIPNREVKPACADGTAMQCGRVGGRHFSKRSPESEMPQGFFIVCLLGVAWLEGFFVVFIWLFVIFVLSLQARSLYNYEILLSIYSSFRCADDRIVGTCSGTIC